MPYIGKIPAIGNYQVLDALTATTTDTYALTKNSVAVFPQTPANCIVSLNGVIQAPFDSYNISGSNIVFASALTASDSIDFITVLGDVLNVGTVSDGTITTAKLADSSVSLAKLTATGTKDATTFLRGDNTFQAVSSDYVLLATSDASASSSVSFDGYFSATYKNYKILCSNLTTSSNNVALRVRFRRSNADVTSANYYYVAVRHYIVDAALSKVGGTGETSALLVNENTASTSGYNSSFSIDLYDPLGTNNYKNTTFQTIGFDNGADNRHHFENGGLGLTDNTSALSGITFLLSSGTITRGNFKLYGIK